jgi:hypothetical protein
MISWISPISDTEQEANDGVPSSDGPYDRRLPMIHAKTAAFTTAAFLLATASAFAQDATTTQEPAMPAKPALTHSQKLALEKSCKSEWTADRKAGKAKDITRKVYIADCMKKGA